MSNKRVLTFKQAEQIRKLKSKGWTYTKLMSKFKCSNTVIEKLLAGKTYQTKEQSQNGERNSNVILTEDDVKKIRATYVPCKNQFTKNCRSIYDLANEFHVDFSTIFKIIKRINWRNL